MLGTFLPTLEDGTTSNERFGGLPRKSRDFRDDHRAKWPKLLYKPISSTPAIDISTLTWFRWCQQFDRATYGSLLEAGKASPSDSFISHLESIVI